MIIVVADYFNISMIGYPATGPTFGGINRPFDISLLQNMTLNNITVYELVMI